ncbi:M56 family metallopeptidase [Clostridium hydrogenum]|uniref:M56 family metallopeptidase n=1 Tax=Clostridium hydrogenum TaxID=2855764 RepID=UPI001F3F2842|nr:M56 family metallopeptidase [Clostridium hydrogenum]
MDFIINSFQLVLGSSIMATFVAIAILLIRVIFKGKIGVKGNYLIWLVLILRLVMPYTPKSQISFFNLINNNKSISKVINVSEAKINNKVIQPSIQTASVNNHNNKIKRDIKDTTNEYLKVAAFIWILGVIILGLKTMITAILFSHKLSFYKELRDVEILDIVRECKNKIKINKNIRVYKTSLVKVPGIFGVFKPKLLLPMNLDKQVELNELRYVIFHEISHIKRRDIEMSCFVFIIQTIHWFNPVLWYSFYKMGTDREIACDALAISALGESQSSNYGMTILKLVRGFKSSRAIYGMESFINSKDEIKRRIKMISKFKKKTYRISIIAVAIIAILAAVMLTNSKDKLLTENNTQNKKVETQKSEVSNNEKAKNDSTEQVATSKENNSAVQNKVASQNGNKTNKSEQSKQAANTQKSSSVNQTSSKEAYYGNWHLQKIVATSPVTAMDENQMQSYMGTKISISKESFSNAKVGTVANPKYIKSTISNDEFYVETKKDLKDIGVEGNSVQRLEVQSNDGSSQGYIYIRDNGSMVAGIDGVFYQVQ